MSVDHLVLEVCPKHKPLSGPAHTIKPTWLVVTQGQTPIAWSGLEWCLLTSSLRNDEITLDREITTIDNGLRQVTQMKRYILPMAVYVAVGFLLLCRLPVYFGPKLGIIVFPNAEAMRTGWGIPTIGALMTGLVTFLVLYVLHHKYLAKRFKEYIAIEGFLIVLLFLGGYSIAWGYGRFQDVVLLPIAAFYCSI